MSNNTKKEKDHERYMNNRETMKAKALEYYEEHKDEINAERREIYKQRTDELKENAMNHRQPWELNDLGNLQTFVSIGLTVPQIAKMTQRTEESIKNMLRSQKWKDFLARQNKS